MKTKKSNKKLKVQETELIHVIGSEFQDRLGELIEEFAKKFAEAKVSPHQGVPLIVKILGGEAGNLSYVMGPENTLDDRLEILLSELVTGYKIMTSLLNEGAVNGSTH